MARSKRRVVDDEYIPEVRKRAKKDTSNKKAEQDVDAHLARLHPIPDSDIPEGLAADNRIATWQKYVRTSSLKVESLYKYTPEKIVNADTTFRVEMKHLADVEPMLGRKFIVDQVETFTAKRKGGPELCRAIHVINSADPDARPLQLYRYFDDEEHSQAACDLSGALDSLICATDANARDLGQVCCTLLDNFPSSLQEDKWDQVTVSSGQLCWPRKLVEFLALRHARLDCWDGRSGAPSFYKSFTTRPSGTWFNIMPPSRLREGRSKKSSAVTLLGLPVLRSGQKKPEFCELWINHGKLQVDNIERDIPDEVHDRGTAALDKAPWNELPDATFRVLCKLTNYMLDHTNGYVAPTKHRFESYAKSLLDPFTKQKKLDDKGGSVTTGPFNGHPLMSIDISIRELAIHRSFIALSASAALEATLSGKLAIIYCSVRKRFAAWYAISCAMRGLAHGVDQLSVWQDMIVRLTQAEHGIITQQQILDDIQNYAANADQQRCCLPCALCLRIHRLEDLNVVEDGRFVCSIHDVDSYYTPLDSTPARLERLVWPADVEFNPEDSVLFRSKSSKLSRAVMRAVKKERKAGGHAIDLLAFLHRFRTCQIPGHPTEWMDVYDGRRRLHDAVYSSLPGGGARYVRHALAPSLEAIFPFVYVNGKVYYHDPGHSGITVWEWNSMKGNNPPSIFPVICSGAIQTVKERQRMQTERISLPEAWDKGFWEDRHNRMDHICRININIPYRLDTRLAIRFTQKEYNLYLEAWRSGIWTKELKSLVHRRYPVPLSMADTVSEAMASGISTEQRSHKAQWISAARRAELDPAKIYRKWWPPWTPAQIQGCIDFMEAVRMSPVLNPCGVTMKTSQTGAPWPFLESNYPEDEHCLWKWWQRFSLRAFWMLDDECDLEHETMESNMTIMLVYVICFYADGGGIDSFLHCKRVHLMRHTAKASLARAEGVLPGAPLRTGLSTPYPSKLSGYIPENRTITVQPWFINLLWHDAPPSEHDRQFERLLSIPPQSPYWYALQECVPMEDFVPRESAMSRRAKLNQLGETPDPDDLVQHDDEDRSHDDYIDFDSTNPGVGQGRQDRELRRGEDWCVGCDTVEDIAKMCECPLRHVGQGTVRFHPTCGVYSDSLPGDVICQPCKTKLDADTTATTTTQPREISTVRPPTVKTTTNTSRRPDGAVQLFWTNSSCFANSTFQALHNIDLIRSVVLSLKGATGNPTSKSGRNPMAWIRGYFPQSQAEASKSFDEYLTKLNHVAHTLAKLFERMDMGSKHIESEDVMNSFLRPVVTLDPSIITDGAYNDASEMCFIILESLFTVTDKSTPGGCGLRRLELDTRNALMDDNPAPDSNGLLPLLGEVRARYDIDLREGKDSELYKAFAFQVTQEFRCADGDCERITRKLVHNTRMTVTMQSMQQGTAGLNELIGRYLDTTHPHMLAERRSITAFCTKQKNDGAIRSWERLTVLPRLLFISFPHGTLFDQTLTNQDVELPELLDLHPHADGVILPSQSNSHNLAPHCIYRMSSLCVYRARHYVTYAPRNGRWTLFDDQEQQRNPRPVHPQDAWMGPILCRLRATRRPHNPTTNSERTGVD
ncbi:hypothetical protein TI39_contig685g00002 [Zymoseptoria brevis]|uniref:USP domain-containing protein n=1 Tax=Zymoseptoria brevis TaxID=1047168 RepID=A0A0F4GFP6_9PEZI|nr:hypothetical protein TI39_contig685g00002 [Zymoseptoria brevis]